MSLAYYGLSFNPFDKQMVQEKDRFLSRDMTEMTQRLDYLKDARGIGVFTARPGMGKSFCLRCFAKSLNPNLYHMEYICLSTVSVMEFYRQFCAALGVSDKGGKPGMFKSIQEQIWYLYKEKRQPLLLAVDEAQYLSTGILNDIKMLMNYGYVNILVREYRCSGGTDTANPAAGNRCSGTGIPHLLNCLLPASLLA